MEFHCLFGNCHHNGDWIEFAEGDQTRYGDRSPHLVEARSGFWDSVVRRDNLLRRIATAIAVRLAGGECRSSACSCIEVEARIETEG